TGDGGVGVLGAYRVHGGGWGAGGEWYRGVHARAEADRGLAAHEDLWYAGHFTANLDTGDAAEVVAWADDLSAPAPRASVVVAAARSRAAELAAGAPDPTTATLTLAADAFIVSGADVVAGYPWVGASPRGTLSASGG